MVVAIGFEGSANKLGVGIIRHENDQVDILANVRDTFITPPGEGFSPRDTAVHHRECALRVTREALKDASLTPKDIDVVCYTKGKIRIYKFQCFSLIQTIYRTWYGRTIGFCCHCCTYAFIIMGQTSCWCQSLCWS